MLDDISFDQEDPILAADEAAPVTFAFDRSMRTKDLDGHLHVESVNISKACVSPYLGREIPNGAELRLEPSRIYMLLRCPKELEAAAPTYENKQLLIKHVGVSADSPQEWLTVGVVSGVHWSPPYLKARLSVWNQKGIDAIETRAQAELSSGYRYEADMTPGTYDGLQYDGIMRNIVGNHVALVAEGRVGPDCFVTDELPQDFYTMKISALVAAAVAAGLIATDKKPEDLTRLINDSIAADAKKAKDEEVSDMDAEDKAACDAAAKEIGCKAEDMVKGADGKWTQKAADAGSKVVESAEDIDLVDAKREGKKVTTDSAELVKAAVAANEALHAARKDVEPLLGIVAMDSAEAVYKAAFDHMTVDVSDVHPSAYRALFSTVTKAKVAPVVGDAAPAKSGLDSIPHINRLRR